MTLPTTGSEDPVSLTFPRLERAHLARLRDWLNTPHVYEWWGVDAAADGLGGPGDKAATLEAVEAGYLPELERGGPTGYHLIVLHGTPIGMIQWYPLAAYPGYAAEIGEPAADAAGIDLFIGDPTQVGRGLGPVVLRTFVESIVFAHAEITRCVGAPDVRNRRSIRAFEKAGFRWVRDADVTGEPAPEHVMVLDRDEAVRPTIQP